MKQLLTIVLLYTLHFMLSCQNTGTANVPKKKDSNAASLTENDSFKNPEEILKSFESWCRYTTHNINLAQDFIGLDIDSGKIDKIDFLTKLNTGNLIPLKVQNKNAVPVYKLYKLSNDKQEIQEMIKRLVFYEIKNTKMEGTQLPGFNFTDINGLVYNKTTTHNKVVVLKCWFINCSACVKEFPELNNLVNEYKQDSDVLFISLASDSRQSMVTFLNKRHFNYAVVPESRKYIEDELGVNMFPTHILVNKNGKIVKVVNDVKDLIPALKKETGKNIL